MKRLTLVSLTLILALGLFGTGCSSNSDLYPTTSLQPLQATTGHITLYQTSRTEINIGPTTLPSTTPRSFFVWPNSIFLIIGGILVVVAFTIVIMTIKKRSQTPKIGEPPDQKTS